MSVMNEDEAEYVKRFRGGLVFKAHRPLYHSTLSSRVIKKKKKNHQPSERGQIALFHVLDLHYMLLDSSELRFDLQTLIIYELGFNQNY